MDNQDPFSRFVPMIEQALRDALRTPNAALDNFYGMMRYHLGWADETLKENSSSGGKRIRPILTLLACEAAGGEPTLALPAAVAVELVHNFSLVHDDIEDRSDFRRHRRTVWKIWGDAHAINLGDGLFALARLQLSRLLDRGAGPRVTLEATQILDGACLALTEGQFLDMRFEGMEQVSLDDYLWMIRGKTAALLACACQLGAIVGTEDTQVIRALHDFGYNLGMAFQIEDDILGIWGDPQVTGKPAGDDVLNRKKTLPVVYAWDRGFMPKAPDAHRKAACVLREVYSQRTVSEADLLRAEEALEAVQAREYCAEVSGEYTSLALSAASHPNLARAAAGQLKVVARSLLGRSR